MGDSVSENYIYENLKPLTEFNANTKLCIYEPTKKLYIIKRADLSCEAAYRSIKLLNNRHLPKIYHIAKKEDRLEIVREYISGDTLADVLKGHKSIPEKEAVKIAADVCDGSSYETLFDADCVTIKTSLYDTMDITADDSGHELYNKNGIRIIGKYVDENTFWGSSVLLYIENTTKEKIIVSCDDMSINGFMVEGYLYTSVYAGKYAIDTITVFSDDLEKNGIKSIDSIELKFRIIDSDTYNTIDETEAITFSAK